MNAFSFQDFQKRKDKGIPQSFKMHEELRREESWSSSITQQKSQLASDLCMPRATSNEQSKIF